MNLNGKQSRTDDDGFDDLGFNEHQMAKLKKSEAFTVEREKEIQQVGWFYACKQAEPLMKYSRSAR
ncbi:hypothetical protein HanOQP8_Chr09g0314231 [Helianthus annuus]|nr:hypothetical protein HanOQP8_Chr09g0314231 [Helianthus annuus]